LIRSSDGLGLARHGDGVTAVCVGHDGGGSVQGELVEVGGELDVGGESFVAGEGAAGLAGHAAHDGGEAGVAAALGFVEGLVVADGVEQEVVFALVMVAIGALVTPEEVGGGLEMAFEQAGVPSGKVYSAK
jgi:hypothetical protein